MAGNTNLLTGRPRRLGAGAPRREAAGRLERARWSELVNGPWLVLCGLAVAVLMNLWPGVLPWSVYAPLIVLAGLFLSPRWVKAIYATYLLEILLTAARGQGWYADLTAALIAFVALVSVMLLMVSMSQSRARLGVQGSHGETMLVDLRDRLRALGELPALPQSWHAETAVESAYGDSFSGDFVVANSSPDGRWLEVALVDVSGKGAQAGTRALLLSGAVGGLLGELEPERFLHAANSYLLRQRWGEGFATAIHVSLDLLTGDFSIGRAGHPAGVQFSAGSGRWSLLDTSGGPLLGVIDGASFPRSTGRLQRGDALVLYTDGVIETRHRDLTNGLDRMLGTAEQLVPHGFDGGAARLCAAAGGGETDDRAVVMIWRDGPSTGG